MQDPKEGVETAEKINPFPIPQPAPEGTGLHTHEWRVVPEFHTDISREVRIYPFYCIYNPAHQKTVEVKNIRTK